MARADEILPQLASLGIPMSRVLFINPDLASAELPPPSTSNTPCAPDCANLRTTAEHAREIARLQIDNARLEIRQAPLVAHIEELLSSVGLARSALTFYNDEIIRLMESSGELFHAFQAMSDELAGLVLDKAITDESRMKEILRIVSEMQTKIHKWDAVETVARDSFSAGSGFTEAATEEATESSLQAGGETVRDRA